MRIPAGDLSPSRAGRRRRSGRRHGRRRARRLPVLLLVLVLAAGAGVAYVQLRDDGTSGAERTVAAPGPRTSACPTPSATPAAALPRPATVTVQVLNGTARDGLVKGVAAELGKRGFRVGPTGNAPRAQPGPAQVSYGPGAAPAARLLAAQVLDAQVVPRPAAVRGSVALTLGAAYTRLRTPAEATAWLTPPAAAGPC